MKCFFFSLLISMLFAGCTPLNPDYDFVYDIIIDDTATNLQSLNSAYDDYNSNLPYPAARSEIYFSSNRNSEGGNFDIICKHIDISYHEKDDAINFSIPSNAGTTLFQDDLLKLINTDYDELGPLSLGTSGWNYFFYANNESGNFDIKFFHISTQNLLSYNFPQVMSDPVDVTITNSDSDDLYPAIYNVNTKLMFCSNREGESFDIYSLNLNTVGLLHDYLVSTDPVPVIREATLSGSGNDKCPSVTGDLLVFASDREGGYGGYDLYYSRLVDGQWTAPVNFGEKINSSSDEYRPITFSFFTYSDLMIFSSNRPGGRGGFDLYCARIDNIIKK